jgi:hypothetical protein
MAHLRQTEDLQEANHASSDLCPRIDPAPDTGANH